MARGGQAAGPDDPAIEDLRARGLANEKAYLAHLRAQGLTIAGADDYAPATLSFDATLAAMRSGVDVIWREMRRA